jgi:outer membrane protein
MKGFVFAAMLVLLLSAGPAFAQPPAQQPPAQPPKPAQPALPAPTPQPPAPFPQGAKIGFVVFQRVINESAEGKASTARIQALQKKKQDEGTAKNKALSDNQAKLSSGGSVMSEAARTQLEKEIEKQQVEMQRFQQDATAEINELQQELQKSFIEKVTPILQQVATEKGLHALFNAQEAGFAWVDPGLDLTNEVIKKLDSGKPSASPK